MTLADPFHRRFVVLHGETTHQDTENLMMHLQRSHRNNLGSARAVEQVNESVLNVGGSASAGLVADSLLGRCHSTPAA